MAGKSTTFSGQFLALIFNGTTIPNIAQNASSPITTLYVSLHTSDPGSSSDQTTNEAAYGDYNRVGIARTSGAWVVTSNSVSPASLITFPTAISGSETEYCFGVGIAATGAGELLYSGSLNNSIDVITGVVPQLLPATAITES